jgi:hypothetical protein
VGVVVGLLWACGGRIGRREDDGKAGRDGNEVGGATNDHAANGASVGLGADVGAQIKWGLQWGWWWGSCGLVVGGLTGGRTTARQGGRKRRASTNAAPWASTSMDLV